MLTSEYFVMFTKDGGNTSRHGGGSSDHHHHHHLSNGRETLSIRGYVQNGVPIVPVLSLAGSGQTALMTRLVATDKTAFYLVKTDKKGKSHICSTSSSS